jgi:hypothetical protein
MPQFTPMQGSFTMKTNSWQKNKIWHSMSVLLVLSMALGIAACSGGGSGGGGGDPDGSTPPGVTQTESWQSTAIRQLQPGGLLTPHIKAYASDDGMVHLVYFDDENMQPGQYNIQLLSWPSTQTLLADALTPTSIATLDNCKTLALAMNTDGLPGIAYQGGAVKDCGGEEQADAMITLSYNNNWTEYTGAIGFVERNPVFQDGLAGGDMDMAIDTNGDIHLIYQFFYEGCDAMNFAYPDLLYVRKYANAPGAEVEEETIEGNTYHAGGGIQNNVGAACSLTLDADQNPIVFYYAELPDGQYGLRMAAKDNGAWEAVWIETGVRVDAISAAMDPDGNLGVAYYVVDFVDRTTSEVSPACLRYAAQPLTVGEDWRITMVDDASLCGKYPSLAFNSLGDPAIAYYTVESYSGYPLENLNLAQKTGLVWEKEVVAQTGNIGLYNTLWFSPDDRPIVSSYSQTEQTIYLLKKE